MTILDHYIIRQFSIAFLFAMAAVLMIFLVIDMMEKLDDFIDANVPTPTIIEYYFAFLPEIVKLMTPVAMLLAALFVMGRMTNQNEISAMKASGVSLYRVLVPFLAVSLVVSLFSLYFNAWVVPKANQRKFSIERVHLQRSSDAGNRFNVFFQDGRTRLVSIGYFDAQRGLATRVSIQEFADTNLTVLVRRYDAREMEWISKQPTLGETATGGWVLHTGIRREFVGGQELLSSFEREPIGRLTITPEQIEKKLRKPDEMSYTQLKEFIENQRNAGQNVARWMVDFHSKISFPFASFIVVFFGVPFAANKRRSGVAIEFGICVAVTFIYLAFMKTSQVFGYNGDLDPLLTAWIANILFFAAAVVNLARVRK
jgi:lipopolysaccharide export system permease protein